MNEEDKIKLNMLRKLNKSEIELIEYTIRFWRMSFVIGGIISFILGIVAGVIIK